MTSKTLLACVALWAFQQHVASISSGAEVSASSRQAPALVRWTTVKGKVRVEGTSNIDDWQVETRAIEGLIEVSPDFPNAGAGEVRDGTIAARGEVWLQARSLRSVEKDGKPFSNKMDSIMHDALKAGAQPRIVYRVGRLAPSAGQRLPDAPAEFEAQGRLVVAGVTNDISMPLYALQLGNDQIRLWGGTNLKMTDFKIQPPAPKIALGLIRTGNEVKISFEWILRRKR